MDTTIKVLVVDDDSWICGATKVLLEAYGFSAVCVENDGQRALQRLQTEGDVRLVLTDWQMPLVDGVALTRRIRATPELAHLKIIMTSGAEDASEPIAAGVDAYLCKPVRAEKLFKLIGSYFP